MTITQISRAHHYSTLNISESIHDMWPITLIDLQSHFSCLNVSYVQTTEMTLKVDVAYLPICWCCLDRGPGSFDVEDATTLSWSSAAVSE